MLQFPVMMIVAVVCFIMVIALIVLFLRSGYYRKPKNTLKRSAIKKVVGKKKAKSAAKESAVVQQAKTTKSKKNKKKKPAAEHKAEPVPVVETQEPENEIEMEKPIQVKPEQPAKVLIEKPEEPAETPKSEDVEGFVFRDEDVDWIEDPRQRRNRKGQERKAAASNSSTQETADQKTKSKPEKKEKPKRLWDFNEDELRKRFGPFPSDISSFTTSTPRTPTPVTFEEKDEDTIEFYSSNLKNKTNVSNFETEDVAVDEENLPPNSDPSLRDRYMLAALDMPKWNVEKPLPGFSSKDGIVSVPANLNVFTNCIYEVFVNNVERQRRFALRPKKNNPAEKLGLKNNEGRTQVKQALTKA